jgi:hypothetical protein
MSNKRPRFSQTESHLAEKSLALPDTQIDFMELVQMIGKELPIPEVLRVSELSWVSPQIAVDGLPLGLREPPRPPISFAFMQPGETALFESLHPSFDCAGVLPENIGNLIAVQALANQKNTVKPVVITGFLGSQYLLLHCNRHDLGIRDLQFTHERALLSQNMAGGANKDNLIMRHYLCRYV